MRIARFNGTLTPSQTEPFLFQSFKLQTVGLYHRAGVQWVCQRCCSRLQQQNPTRSSPPRRKSANIYSQQRNLFSSISFHNASTHPSPPRSSLPSHSESLRSPTSRRLTHLMDNLQSSLFVATQRLNDLTGYTGIEALKISISEQEAALERTRSTLAAARTAYSDAIKQRSASQREVNELLQRKHNWSPRDLERFTELYRNDHANELAESATQEALTVAEREAEEAGQKLSASILARYHEEQIWSDKIRRMSTWGTWGLMGVNVLLFLVFQVAVEPWRRKRLVRGFEEKVVEAMEKGKAEARERGVDEASSIPTERLDIELPKEAEKEVGKAVSADGISMDTQASTAAIAGVETAPHEEMDDEILKDTYSTKSPSTYRRMTVVVNNLFSNRQVKLRQVDLTALVLEGAAAGFAVAGIFVWLLRPR